MQGHLAFVNVTLSGQHYFLADCDQDWCTHCLNPDLLVLHSDGSYRTVIDDHVVNLDEPMYWMYQTRCNWGSFSNAFEVFETGKLSFEGSSLTDMRSRWPSFVYVSGSLTIRQTNIERMDTSDAFIRSGRRSFILIEDSVLTGLNRDHAYSPTLISDTGLLAGRAVVTVRRSRFEDNLVLESSFKRSPALISVFNTLEIEDTQFRRCTGTMEVTMSLNLTNVLFEAHFARSVVLLSYENTMLTRCQFIANHSIRNMLNAAFTVIDSSLFINNRAIGTTGDSLIVFRTNTPVVTNCTFEANGALDSSFKDYWSVYYLGQGLLNDNEISTEMATWVESSICRSLIQTAFLSFTLLNSRILDRTTGTPCLNALTLEAMLSNTGLLSQISSTFISSRGERGVFATSYMAGTLTLEDTVLEGAGALLGISGLGGANYVLNATNVTFQKAAGAVMRSASVTLTSVFGRFVRCKWLDNIGLDAGGIVVREGSLWLRECEFRNNSCSANAGDIYVSSEVQTAEVDFGNSSFAHSRSILSAASVLLAGRVIGKLENCSFSAAKSESGMVLRTAHTEGSVVLAGLVFVDIDLPGAALIQVSAGTAATTTLEGLQVLQCSFLQGIAIDSWQGSPTVLSRFNLFSRNYGSVVSLTAGVFSDFGSVFESNAADSELYFQGSHSSATFLNSVFTRNRPSSTVGMIYTEGPNASLSFLNCSFDANNELRSNGVMHLQPGVSVVFLSCGFRGHTSPLVVSQALAVLVTGCSFEDNGDLLRVQVGQAVIAECSFARVQPSLAAITVINSNFTLLRSNFTEVSTRPLLSGLSSNITLINMLITSVQYDGDIVALVDSTLYVSLSSFLSISSGSSLLALNLCVLTLSQVNISEANAERSLVSITESTVDCTAVQVTNSASQVMQVSKASRLTLESCKFMNISTQQQVGVLDCLACTNITISNCYFAFISASLVGGVSSQSTYIEVNNTDFTSVKGQESGALRLSAVTALIAYSHFDNNTAVSAGGALYLAAQSASIHHSSFRFNTAQSGGGIYWTRSPPVLVSVHFANNEANYGPDQASYMAQLRVDNSSRELASGQIYRDILRVYIEDHIGQVIKTDYQTRASLSGVGLSGLLEATARAGQLEFTGFSATAVPGSNRIVSISADLLRFQFALRFRHCILGEKLENSTCVPCPVDTYSLSINSTQCRHCPDTAECPGDGQLYPKSGFSRPNETSDIVQSCPRAQACLGHEGFQSRTGRCAELYSGKRCQSCVVGARRSGRDRCSSCPASSSLTWQASLVALTLLPLWLGQAIAPVRVQTLLRTMQHYLQLTALLADFDFGWPEALQGFFSLHRYLGNGLQYFLPIQCIFTESFIVSTLIVTLAPLVAILGLTVLWAIAFLVRGIQASLSEWILVSLTYLHPFLLREAASLWSCEQEETGSWLRSELEVRCWSFSHRVAALAIGLPALIIWGVGIPAAVLLVIVHQRQQPRPGPLRAGYRDQRFYWTVVLLLLKACLALLYVFTAKWSAFEQALTVVLLLFGAVVLQVQGAPYQIAEGNRVEMRGLLLVLSIAYSGLYFSTIGPSSVLLSLLLGVHLWIAASKAFTYGISRLYSCLRKTSKAQVVALA